MKNLSCWQRGNCVEDRRGDREGRESWGVNMKYIIYVCENRIMKLTKNSKGRWGLKKVNRVSLSKVHYMHVFKYHSVTPLYN
jgi:hypothetical protein